MKKLFLAVIPFIFLLFLFQTVRAEYAFPSVDLNANKTSINEGEFVILTWTSTNATSCNGLGGWLGVKPLSGSEEVKPQKTTTYKINCSNQYGLISQDSITINVNNGENQNLPSVSITANPKSILRGESTIISWNSSNADSCYAYNGWSGSKSLSGSKTVSPSVNTTYSIRCSNENGSSSDSITVIVNEPNNESNQNSNSIFASCVANPSLVRVGQRVVFAAGYSGGEEPINISWSGAVSGDGKIKYASFQTPGLKTATLTVTDARGNTAKAYCSTQVQGYSYYPITYSTPIPSPLSYNTHITPSITSPKNLYPNKIEFPADTKEVTLRWYNVDNASGYAVRVNDNTEPELRDERNNCQDNPHYVCINKLESNSITIKVKAGHSYNWWVHSIDSKGKLSNPSSAEFSVKKENKTFASIFLADNGSLSFWGYLLLSIFAILIILMYHIGKKKGAKTQI